MAIVLPSPHLEHVTMTPGQRRFAARLISKLDPEYQCWFNVPIGEQQLRPNFLLLHPSRGILVLEVRDWHLSALHSFDAEVFSLQDEGKLQLAPNPLAQARAHASAIKDLLEHDPLLVEQSDCYYKGHLLLPWGYGVVMGNISRQQFIDSGMNLSIAPNKIICQNEMLETVHPIEFQERLWGMCSYTHGTVLDQALTDRIRWHLFPDIRVEHTKASAEKASTITHARNPVQMMVMDKQQETISRNLGAGHRMIHGVAGSGKTLILLNRALQLSQAKPAKPILLLCYNKNLAAKLSEQLTLRGAADNIHVRHFYGWCKELCTRFKLNLQENKKAPLYELQALAAIEAAANGQLPGAIYSAVLIDESHDFEADWFRLIRHVLDSTTDALLLAYDDVQTVYKRKRPKSWASVGINVSGMRSRTLRVNYRTPPQTAKAAYEFVTAFIDEAKTSADMPVVRPDLTRHKDSTPNLRRFDSLEEELHYIAAWLQQQANKNIPYSRMAVLCRFDSQVSEISDALRALDLPTLPLTNAANIKKTLRTEAINVLTIHASKGLEFDIVAIPNVGCMPSPKANPEEEGRILYVGMTRAINDLLLTHHTDSSFTRRLEGEDKPLHTLPHEAAIWTKNDCAFT